MASLWGGHRGARARRASRAARGTAPRRRASGFPNERTGFASKSGGKPEGSPQLGPYMERFAAWASGGLESRSCAMLWANDAVLGGYIP